MGAHPQRGALPRGFNSYRVIGKKQESAVITSLLLATVEPATVPTFIPGQFLTVRLAVEDGVTVLRNYSLSGDAQNASHLRISVKRESAPAGRPDLPPGRGSNFLHDQVRVGDLLEIAGPTGAFILDQDSKRPVVLFSGGVGLTPMISMLHWLSRNSTQPVYFIHACEDGSVHAFRDEVLELAGRRPGIHVHFCYRSPSPDDCERGAFHCQGLISREILQTLLPLDDYEVYLCGPPPFMQANWRLLRGLGIGAERIHYEFFGPATVLEEERDQAPRPAPSAAMAAAELASDLEGDRPTVQFLPSGTRVVWDPSCHSLLELAEQAGLAPAFNCRTGICNTCHVGLRQGQVEYFEEPLEAPANGSVLLCCSRPIGTVTLDLSESQPG